MKSATNQKGVIHTLPLLIIVAAVGVISFLLISSTFPLNGLFGVINPKPDSHAAGPVGVWTNVTPSGIDLNPNGTAASTGGVANNFGVQGVMADPANPGTFYAPVTYQGLWKSTDWGSTWSKITVSGSSPIDNGRPGFTIAPDGSYMITTALYPINGVSNGAWKSTDGGQTWTKATVGAPNGDDLGGFAINPNDKNRVLASSHSPAANGYHFYESLDAGLTWNDQGLIGNTAGAALVWVDNNSLLAVGDGDNGNGPGTWRGVRSGSTWPWSWNWTKVSTQQHWHGGNQTYIDPTNGAIFTGGGYGIQKSTDKGLTWTTVSSTYSAGIVGTASTLYSTAHYASQGGFGPWLMHSSRTTGTSWISDTNPAAMNNGWLHADAVFDGANYIIVAGDWNAGIWRYVEPASGATPTPSVTAAPTPTPAPSAAPTTSYNSSFPLTENPISEGGRWLNGATNGLDWTDVSTVPGKIFGNQSPSTPKYKDPVAILTGSWAPDQQAQGTVFCNNPNASFFQEVELHLRFSLTAHNAAGYEIFSRCQKNPSGYFSIVRWNGPAANFTELLHLDGTQYGVQSGDVLKATAIGNVITGYINGVQVGQVTDSTYPTGNPGVGFNYGVGTTNTDFGFTNFSASAIGSTPVPSASPQPTATPTGKVGDLDNDGDVDIFDYSTLVTNFGRTGTNIPGDLDHDGDVDIFDYSALVTNFGK